MNLKEFSNRWWYPASNYTTAIIWNDEDREYLYRSTQNNVVLARRFARAGAVLAILVSFMLWGSGGLLAHAVYVALPLCAINAAHRATNAINHLRYMRMDWEKKRPWE